MASLTVNVDMVAVLREARGLAEPDPAQAAFLAEMAGADGIAIQLRRSRRFIRDRDLYILRGVVKTKLTVEMPLADDMIEKALEVKPWMVTLVADHDDAESQVSPINPDSTEVAFTDFVARLNAVGINVAFFVEPEVDAIKGAAKAGASAVLISCAAYSEAGTVEQAQDELDRLDRAVAAASKAGLAVHCGRGLNYRNIRPLSELALVDEFVIGYAICARALLVGYEKAVQEMLRLVQEERSQA